MLGLLITFLFIGSDYNRSALDGMGKAIEVTKYTEKLVPSTRFVAVDGVAPLVDAETFVAPSAAVIGDVTIGKASRYDFRIARTFDHRWHLIMLDLKRGKNIAFIFSYFFFCFLFFLGENNFSVFGTELPFAVM